jgi:hypothetical protein
VPFFAEDFLQLDHKDFQLLTIIRPVVYVPANPSNLLIHGIIHPLHISPLRWNGEKELFKDSLNPCTTTLFVRGLFRKLKIKIYAIEKTGIGALALIGRGIKLCSPRSEKIAAHPCCVAA